MIRFLNIIGAFCFLYLFSAANVFAAKYNTIMYTEDAIRWLEEAVKANKQGVPLEILLPELFPSKKQQQEPLVRIDIPDNDGSQVVEIIVPETIEEEPIIMPSEAPSYYLKSIMYFSPDNWSIWLNDNKISSSDESVGVKVIKVSKNEAAFLIEDSKIDYIYPEWESEFYEFGGGRFASNNKNIVVDLNNKNISFILSPNQSFVTSTMTIEEGKKASVPVSEAIPSEGVVDTVSNMLFDSDDSDGFPITDAEQKEESLLRGHDPVEGIVDMQQYMGQLNMLKSALDSAN